MDMVEQKLSYLMTIDGYEVYLEDEQLELYESATKEDIPIDLSVWIRVMLSDEDGIFDPTEDYVLCNVTFLGKISDFEQTHIQLESTYVNCLTDIGAFVVLDTLSPSFFFNLPFFLV